MSYAPCKNTNCKSYGRPHPNCKCYGEMAHGGDVKEFCEKGLAHQPGCEFFADGGIATALSVMDPLHAVAGHLAHSGLVGLLKISQDHDMEKYDRAIKKGHKNIESEIERVFKNERASAPEDRSKHHKTIEDWIAKGGITNDIQQEVYNQNAPRGFSAGGDVTDRHPGVLHSHPIEQAYPDQNIMLQTAKGRASNYLSGLKPQEHTPKLAFDAKPDQTEQKKKYQRAMKIADTPLSIMHDLSKGTLTPEHIQHMQAMYPEVLEAVQKKATEKIIKSQLEGKKPNAKVRQGMSLLMGTSLSGPLTPQSIMAAQSVFQAQKSSPEDKQPSQQATKKQSGSKKALSNSEKSFLTGDQAREVRQQRLS